MRVARRGVRSGTIHPIGASSRAPLARQAVRPCSTHPILSRFFIFLYLVVLLVRPQDWFEPVLGLPTSFVVTLPMFLGGLAAYLGDRERYRVPHNWLLPTYIAFIFVSTLVVVDAGSAVEQTNIFGKRALAFFPVFWLLGSPEKIQFTIRCYLWIILFLAFQAMLQAATGLSWGGMTLMPGYTEIRVRWHGDWDGPNVFAILFLIGIAFALELLFGPYGLFTRLWAASVVAASCVAIYFTNSRGAVLALLAIVAFYFKDRFSKPVAITLAAVAIVAITAFGPSRMSEVNTKEASASERSWLWEQGLTMLRASPVFGVGRGQFSKHSYTGLLAHNNYVQNFAEGGLPGFFLFVAMIWFAWRAGSQLVGLAGPEHGEARSMGRMIQGVVVGYAVVTFFVVMELELLYFVLGIAMAMYATHRARAPELPRLALARKEALGIVAVMSGILMAIYLISVKGIV